MNPIAFIGLAVFVIAFISVLLVVVFEHHEPRGKQTAPAGHSQGGLVNAPETTVFEVADRCGITHLVTEHEIHAGRRSGRYTTVCSAEVIAASLTEPHRGRCGRCYREVP